MTFVPGDRVMVESTTTGYDPPWCVGKIVPTESAVSVWDGWVKVQHHGSAVAFMYPNKAVRHID